MSDNVKRISSRSNLASFHKVQDVLQDCLNDVSSNPNQYNKMLILLLNDRNDQYQLQPYSAGFVHDTEVIALLNTAGVMYACEVLAYVDGDDE